MGENFLYVYVKLEIFEDVLEILDEIVEVNLFVLKDLLVRKDVFGRILWSNMIDDVNILEDFVQKVLLFGLFVNIVDNFGNIVLYRIVGVLIGVFYFGIIELFI